MENIESHRLEVDGVPGVLWTPPAGGSPSPLVLLGHGRGSHKTEPLVEAVALDLVGRGCAVVALDAAEHGERATTDADPPPKPDPRQSAREWRACLDLLAGDPGIDPAAVGYWGLSMGTSLGIALLAVEPRIRVAALGLMHTRWYPETVADAARVTCPLIFLVQWDDGRVPRDEAFALFDAFASADKRLHAYPGDHGELSSEALAASETFLATHLNGH